jgi:Tfp pilus assembly protein PilX
VADGGSFEEPVNMKKQSAISNQQSAFKNEKGFVLVVALLALLVVTVLAVLALSTSTTEVMIAGNTRIRELNLATADSAVALTEPVMINPDRTKYTFLDTTEETNLRNEIYCTSVMNTDSITPSSSNYAPNYTIQIGGNTIDVDVDMINRADPEAGYALDEGVSSPIKKNYIINARSTSGLGSENEVGAIYYVVGYCE